MDLLVVDDDEVDQLTVARGLIAAALPVNVSRARDGVEALDMLRAEPARAGLVVLLDLNLPRMNGLEFLRALRADAALANTVVVVLTTSTDPRDRREAHALNVAGYFAKPLDFGEFVELLRTIHRYWGAVLFP